MNDGIRHGLYYGYQQHMKRKVPPCDECREANRRYQRDYRARSAEARRKDAIRNSVRSRALERLAELHRSDFLRLLETEREAARRWV